MPYRLRYLNIVPVGGTVFRGLGGVALLKEVHQWDQVLRLDSLDCLPFTLSALLMVGAVIGQLFCSNNYHTCHLSPNYPSMVDSSPSGTINQHKLLLP